VANTAVSVTYDPMTPLIVAAVIYWSMVQLIRIGFARLETHLNRHLQAVA
jgi:ABC-type arginine/histidine transport system permease subunit